MYEVNSYISLPGYVVFNSINLGFIFVDNLHTLADDFVSMFEHERISSRWLWYSDPKGEEDQTTEIFKKTQVLHSKYKDFENEKLFKDINYLVGFHSIFLNSVFSILTQYKIITPEKCESKKKDFLRIFSNCYVSALFLGLDKPWKQPSEDVNYYLEIRKIINVLIYISYKAIQENIEILPKGNINGLVELSLDVFNSIRQIIEWTYWYGSEFAIPPTEFTGK